MRLKLETETVTKYFFKDFKTKKQQEFKTNSFEVSQNEKMYDKEEQEKSLTNYALSDE